MDLVSIAADGSCIEFAAALDGSPGPPGQMEATEVMPLAKALGPCAVRHVVLDAKG